MSKSLLERVEKAIHKVYFPHPSGHDLSILAAGAVMRVLNEPEKATKRKHLHRFDRCPAGNDCTKDLKCVMRHDGKFEYCKCGERRS